MILTEKISELIGIILGDGHISYDLIKHTYFFSIYLNGVDEKEYLEYVKSLIADIYSKDPFENWERNKPSTREDAKGVSLTIYGKEIVNDLLDLGLKSGNKVKNQVGVPNCIFSSDKFKLKCLKGLFDTDGSVFLNKSRKSIYLSFSNSSLTLVKDFIRLCNKFNIISNFYGPYNRVNKETGKTSIAYSALILKKEMVKNFLTLINPEKWNDANRREFIGTLLIVLKNPENYNKLVREHISRSQNKQLKFSHESLIFLRNFCDNEKLQVGISSIRLAISESFEFKYLNYSLEYAEYLKDLSIRDGSIREVVKSINKKYRITTKNYIEKLFAEPEYSDLYGQQGYSRWLNHNFEILIDDSYDKNINKRTIRIRRFSFNIKKEICILIFNILKSSKNQNIASDIKKELFYQINNLDLSQKLIENEVLIENNVSKPKILLFERLSFLLNSSEYSTVINEHFSILITFIKEMLNLINFKEKMELESLRKYIRNKLKINWRSNNIKKILVALNIYEELIIETEQTNSSQIENNPKEKKNTPREHPSKSLEKIKPIIAEKKNFPKNNIVKSNLIDEDFLDPYLWFSPQVRKAIQSKAESLIDQVHADVSTQENFSDPWEDVSNYNVSDLDSTTAEDLIDDPYADIIPDQDLDPNPEVPEIQEDIETDDIDINNPVEEIEDVIPEQQDLIEDQINDLEQINEPESREVDLRPDDFDPVNEPPYDPISQPVTEIIPPPELPSVPDNVNTPQQNNGAEPQDSPQNQQDQEENPQVPEKSQDELGTEQSIEEIPIDSKTQDIEPIINEPIEPIQIPELGESGCEDSPDKTDSSPEDPEKTNQDEIKDPPDLDEKDEDTGGDKEDKKEIGDEEEDDKDEKKEEDEKDDEQSKEDEEDQKEDEGESDKEPQEDPYDDIYDFEEEREHEFTPEDIYDIMREIYERMYPQIYSFQSLNFGSYPVGEIDFTDKFGEKDNLPGSNDCIDNFGEDRDEKIPIDSFDELSEKDDEEDKFDNLT